MCMYLDLYRWCVVHVMWSLMANKHRNGLGAPFLLACHLLLLICACSMDKLYDLMVMGLKYQLLCCRQTSELLQVSQEPLLVHSLLYIVGLLSIWVHPDPLGPMMHGASTMTVQQMACCSVVLHLSCMHCIRTAADKCLSGARPPHGPVCM